MTSLEFQARLRFPSGFQLDVEFQREAGLLALVGPSGSGKTTILSILAGIHTPDLGRIRFGSQVLLDTRQRIDLAPERRQIGYVFQDGLLFPHLTVKGNLLFGQRRNRDRASIGTFESVARMLEIEELLVRWPTSLSGGERQRVAVGRALLQSPQLLLLDEPFSAVDEERRERLLTRLTDLLFQTGLPTIWVTHNRAEVGRLAQGIIEIVSGRVD